MTDKGSPSLLRCLNLWDAGAIVMGCMIGAGIFRMSASVAQYATIPGQFLLVWLLGGLLSLAGAVCYAELSSRFPQTGGDYIYLTKAYGASWGFIFGWTKLFVQRTGTIAILAFVFSEYACGVFGWPPEAEFETGVPFALKKCLATSVILLLAGINMLGIRSSKNTQNIFTALKISGLLLIVGSGIWMHKGAMAHLFPLSFIDGEGTFRAIGLALIPVLWTYNGWENGAYVGEEVRDPVHTVPRAIIAGLLATTALYLTINLVYLYYIPLKDIPHTPLVASTVMDKIWRGSGGRIIGVMVMISAIGALNGFILTGGRLLFALGKDHALFGRLGRIHPATHTPIQSIICVAAVALVLVWTGTLDQIVTYSTVVIYLFFAASGCSLFIFRWRDRLLWGKPLGMGDTLTAFFRAKERSAAGTYLVPGFPGTPLLFILMCLIFVGNAIVEKPVESLLGIAVAGLGFPLYVISKWMACRRIPDNNFIDNI